MLVDGYCLIFFTSQHVLRHEGLTTVGMLQQFIVERIILKLYFAFSALQPVDFFTSVQHTESPRDGTSRIYFYVVHCWRLTQWDTVWHSLLYCLWWQYSCLSDIRFQYRRLNQSGVQHDSIDYLPLWWDLIFLYSKVLMMFNQGIYKNLFAKRQALCGQTRLYLNEIPSRMDSNFRNQKMRSFP